MSDTSAMIAVMQAFEAGKAIEHTVKGKSLPWLDTDEPWWDWVSYEYRIKPEPLIAWVNVYPDGYGSAYVTEGKAREALGGYASGRTVKMQEVIDE